VEETRVPGENHRPVASHWQTLSHNVVSSTPHNFSGDRHWLHTFFTEQMLTNKYCAILFVPSMNCSHYEIWNIKKKPKHQMTKK
jgi:hypothetical protein